MADKATEQQILFITNVKLLNLVCTIFIPCFKNRFITSIIKYSSQSFLSGLIRREVIGIIMILKYDLILWYPIKIK